VNGYLSRLNPAERRFVVGVGLLFFVVVNIFWIWPHFSDWGRLQRRLETAYRNKTKFQTEVDKIPHLHKEIAQLMSEGADVPAEEQAYEFLRTIQAHVARSGLGFTGAGKTSVNTNQFFIEQIHSVTVQGDERQLVDFLYSIGSGTSLIRARELSIRPDQARHRLSATVTLVASYQKKARPPSGRAPARATAAAGRANPPAASPQPAGQRATQR